jgi:hypothetical protein
VAGIFDETGLISSLTLTKDEKRLIFFKYANSDNRPFNTSIISLISPTLFNLDQSI